MESISKILDHEAVHFIELLDTAAFEGYLRGEATGEQYRALASQIARLQTLAFDILTELQRMGHLGT